MDLLADSREVIRNDVSICLLSFMVGFSWSVLRLLKIYFTIVCFQQGLLLLQQLTKSNAAIQKIVAFENAFERLLDIITEEGSSDGGTH